MSEIRTKYERLVEKGKTDTAATIERMAWENDHRVDRMVKPESILLVANDTGIHAELKGVGDLKFTRHSLAQVYGQTGVPSRFADQLRDLKMYDLLNDNLNRLARRKLEQGIMVRAVDDTIRGWLSPSYRRIDSFPVIEAFYEEAKKRGMTPLGGRVTDYRNQLKMFHPEIYEVAPEEFVCFGLCLVTGDYGEQAFQIQMLICRIHCANMAMGYDFLRKVHLGSRFSFDNSDTITLSQQTLDLDLKTLASSIKDITGQFGDYVTVTKRKIEEAVADVNYNPETFYRWLKDKGVRKGIVEQVRTLNEMNVGVEVLPQIPSRWRLSNTLSFIAHGSEVENPDEAIDLENLAMQAITN